MASLLRGTNSINSPRTGVGVAARLDCDYVVLVCQELVTWLVGWCQKASQRPRHAPHRTDNASFSVA
ncbi:hypothetical protein E2C01_054850 [Portunus trituberculatus]|uniref:Uncharacterized protein n=1 Tax=Portunus trituberculatus TaxID=210409 RepID=A0A5B7GT52_PORTR|nr:hypothetical protein [Portunus trituberculatus]